MAGILNVHLWIKNYLRCHQRCVVLFHQNNQQISYPPIAYTEKRFYLGREWYRSIVFIHSQPIRWSEQTKRTYECVWIWIWCEYLCFSAQFKRWLYCMPDRAFAQCHRWLPIRQTSTNGHAALLSCFIPTVCVHSSCWRRWYDITVLHADRSLPWSKRTLVY